jgi:hypothetical protein
MVGPQFLTAKVKSTRIASSMKMLKIFGQQEWMHFAGFITGDESWLFLEYSRNRASRFGNENSPERISHKIDRDTQMLTIFSSAIGPLVED